MSYYTFNGDQYNDDTEGQQELLEAISDAILTEAMADPDLTTDDEQNEAHSMAFDGTHIHATFWQNLMAIMQQSPYEVNVGFREEEMD